MTIYEYRCGSDGVIQVGLPMGTAPVRLACPHCGLDMARVYSAPRLARGSTRAMALIDRTEASADAPEVVTSVPSTGRRRAPRVTDNPVHQRLPRP